MYRLSSLSLLFERRKKNNFVIRISTPTVGILDEWRVSRVKDDGGMTPNLKVVYVKLTCVYKSSVVDGISSIVRWEYYCLGTYLDTYFAYAS